MLRHYYLYNWVGMEHTLIIILIAACLLTPLATAAVHYAKNNNDDRVIQISVWAMGLFPIMLYHYLTYSRHSFKTKIGVMSPLLPGTVISIVAGLNF